MKSWPRFRGWRRQFRLEVDLRRMRSAEIFRMGAEAAVRMRTEKSKEVHTNEDEKTQLETQGSMPQRCVKRIFNEVAHLSEMYGNVKYKYNEFIYIYIYIQ